MLNSQLDYTAKLIYKRYKRDMSLSNFDNKERLLMPCPVVMLPCGKTTHEIIQILIDEQFMGNLFRLSLSEDKIKIMNINYDTIRISPRTRKQLR